MLSLFRRRSVYPKESKWHVLTVKQDGKPQYVRLNTSAKELLGHPDFKFLLGIAVRINAPGSEGLPNAREFETLSQLEDMIVARLESEQRSLCVLISTMHGVREFMFYTRDRNFAQTSINALSKEITSHKIVGTISEDPKWSFYQQFGK
jgi:hypothetical protein